MANPVKTSCPEPRTRVAARRELPTTIRIAQEVENLLMDINWCHVAFKILAYTWLLLTLSLAFWSISSFYGIVVPQKISRQASTQDEIQSYFVNFAGYSECGINTADLYVHPSRHGQDNFASNDFCMTRKQLLQALSNGGRVGFDAAYTPRGEILCIPLVLEVSLHIIGCHYRWFNPIEICFVLERFDRVIFVGDEFLQSVYSGLVILLRQNLVTGAMQREIRENSAMTRGCYCNDQFTKETCAENYITSSKDIPNYLCSSRTEHMLLKVSSGSLPSSTIQKIQSLVPPTPRSNYKPIPIIHSLAPSTANYQEAGASLMKILELADASKRKTPLLWVGPTAAGHLEIKNRKGNQEIWDFSQQMSKMCMENDIEVLGMWNMTAQASSWDGMHFGEKVAITQAMMVINWLSRLESS